MGDLHVYRAQDQPATRFVTVLDIGQGERRKTVRLWTRHPRNRLLPAFCCRRQRPAKNLTVRVYYDAMMFWCRPGKGCKA